MCQSSMYTDQILLDILRVEGMMFNAKFTYLKIYDVTQGFRFRKVIQNILKTQRVHKLRLAEYSNCNIPFNSNTNVIPITDLVSKICLLSQC